MTTDTPTNSPATAPATNPTTTPTGEHGAGGGADLVARPDRPVAVDGPAPWQEPAELEQARDLGWVLVVLSATSALLASWMMFPKDAVGMSAGYWVSLLATIALVAVVWLRSTLPAAPAIGVTLLAGLGMTLLGVLMDYPTTVAAVMAAGGVGIALGALMQTSRRAS
ncbi:hypothetical protein [Nocardioides nanhaiensis]|uniref:Uncharacterized protein n=1 Tax=Nocardioides nanhaiensis TaxID=1476871 RepID=A0ABP8WHK6_9ACTN